MHQVIILWFPYSLHLDSFKTAINALQSYLAPCRLLLHDAWLVIRNAATSSSYDITIEACMCLTASVIITATSLQDQIERRSYGLRGLQNVVSQWSLLHSQLRSVLVLKHRLHIRDHPLRTSPHIPLDYLHQPGSISVQSIDDGQPSLIRLLAEDGLLQSHYTIEGDPSLPQTQDEYHMDNGRPLLVGTGPTKIATRWQDTYSAISQDIAACGSNRSKETPVGPLVGYFPCHNLPGLYLFHFSFLLH